MKVPKGVIRIGADNTMFTKKKKRDKRTNNDRLQNATRKLKY